MKPYCGRGFNLEPEPILAESVVWNGCRVCSGSIQTQIRVGVQQKLYFDRIDLRSNRRGSIFLLSTT